MLPPSTPLPPPVPDPIIAESFAPAEKPRRVLVYAPLAYSTPHFETDLEIAQRHLDLGDEVELMLCNAELSSCQLNPLHEARRCVQCVSRNLQGAAQLSARVPVHGLLTALTPDDHARLVEIPRQFSDQQALRSYHFDGFDAGLATLSSIIDFARSLTIDTKRHADLVHRTLRASVSAFLAVKRLLAAKTYDRVYIYNGRWSMVRSAVRACEQLRVSYFTHERGSDFRKFALYRDTLPHDKDDYRARIAAVWEHAREFPQTLPLADAFFQERRQRVEKTWFSHVKHQELGRVPSDWNRGARRIVFFTSSEFEFAAIGEGCTGRIYSSQALATRRISARLAQLSPESHLWIRVHPNDKSPAAVKRWQEATAGLSNVTVILPEERIDSYSLLEGAERILTFGSTIGVEATYWGKPSICADFSFWDGLDAHYDATSEDDLFALLTRPDLAPKPRENALRCGYYLNTNGGEFLHFSTAQISDYEFKSPFRGRCLKPDYNDLRQRLLALYQVGDIHRTLAVARLCIDFKADDGMAHSLLILCRLRLRETTEAVDALEHAARQTTPPQLEQILKTTGRPLLDAIQQCASDANRADFESIATRAGQVMLRLPAYASIGQKLIALAAPQAASATA